MSTKPIRRRANTRDNGLTPQMEAFVTHLACGMSQAEAYRTAYPGSRRWKDASVWREATRLVSHPGVKVRLQEMLDKAAQANEITVERIERELARLGFYDLRKLVNEDGTPKRLSELDEDTARALVGLEVVQVGNADVGIGQVLKFRLAEKKGALELLGKRRGMFTDKVQISNPDGGPVQIDVKLLSDKALSEIMEALDATHKR